MPIREGAGAPRTLALRASQRFVYREMTERVILVIVVDTSLPDEGERKNISRHERLHQLEQGSRAERKGKRRS